MPQDVKDNYNHFSAVALQEKKCCQIGDFEFIPFQVPHDDVFCFGYLIKVDNQKILWLTDFSYCPYTFATHRVNHLLVEANYSKEYLSDEAVKKAHVLRGHASIDVALGIIDANKTDTLQTVLLCHLSRESANPIEFKAKAEKVAKCAVYVAEKGLEIELKNMNVCPFM